ncbi:hypothetical protein V6N13_061546 [Hibiscus sabdariffa]
MQDASGMIGRAEARAASFLPRPSLCVGQRARGTCCPPFLFRFENRVNGEWAEGKKKGKAEVVLQMAKRGGSTGKEWEIFKDDFFVLLAKRRAK